MHLGGVRVRVRAGVRARVRAGVRARVRPRVRDRVRVRARDEAHAYHILDDPNPDYAPSYLVLTLPHPPGL